VLAVDGVAMATLKRAKLSGRIKGLGLNQENLQGLRISRDKPKSKSVIRAIHLMNGQII
jgi:hypothetical protein